MTLTLLLFGYRKLQVCASELTSFLELCLYCGAGYTDFALSEQGDAEFLMTLSTARKMKTLCMERGIHLRYVGSGGLPLLFWRCLRRPGLAVGVLLGVVLLVLSRNVVWDIRISGNEKITEREIRKELKAGGLFVGSYIPALRIGELENRVLLSSETLSWITVNLDGTVARVQVIERTEPQAGETGRLPANLVAGADGQIEQIMLYRGNCLVKMGQAVKKGELLVSGIYESASVGLRYTRAAGQVLARTERVIRLEIPFDYEEKVYQNEKCVEIMLHFFDFSIKIYKKNRNTDQTCDIIEEEIGFDLLGGAPLPMGITSKKAHAYTVSQKTRTEQEAVEAAYAVLERELSSLTSSVELLEKKIVTKITEEGVTLECTLSCIEDIAVQSEFELIE